VSAATQGLGSFILYGRYQLIARLRCGVLGQNPVALSDILGGLFCLPGIHKAFKQ